MTFRFDDVSINSDLKVHFELTDYLIERGHAVIWAISPVVSSIAEEGRVFPKIWNAYSDYTRHFQLDRVGLPEVHPNVTRASHGLVHVDHRLLSKEAQELSIVLSCSITDSVIFVPPFNKWNEYTERVCHDNNIKLIKFESGWKSMECNDYDPINDNWYLHAREWTIDKLHNWFK